MKSRIFSVTSLIVLITVLLAVAVLRQIPPLDFIETELLKLRAPLVAVPPESPVLAVRVDEQDMSRDRLAGLVQRLAAQKAEAILLHLPLDSPESDDLRSRLRTLREEWRRSPGAGHNALLKRIERDLRELEKQSDGDALLAAALREAGNVVLVAPILTGGEPDGSAERLKAYALKVSLPDWSWQEHLQHFSNPVPPPWKPEPITSVRPPRVELLRQAAALGYSYYPGKEPVAEGLMLMPLEQRLLPSASLAATVVASKATFRSLDVVARGPSVALLAGKRNYPVDHQLRLLPLPAQMQATLQVRSASDIFSLEEDAGSMAGKTVVVGPFVRSDAPEYGEAHLLAQLLGDFHISRPGWLPLVEVLVLLYFAIFLLLIVPRLPRRTAWTFMALFLLVWGGGATILLVNLGWWFQLTPPVILTVVGMLLLTLQRLLRVRQEEFVNLHCDMAQILQEKGLLDRALDVCRKCPPKQERTRELVYNLGLDLERKRRFGQALGAYEFIARGGRYKDVEERISRLRSTNGTVSLGKKSKDATVVLEKGAVHPTLGRYEIVSELGQGAMGTVYLGRDPKINREVAIKTLEYGGVDDTQLPMIKERFFREAEAAGRLNHPGIVTIFDAGEEHDLAYLAMEFLSGEDLSSLCKPDKLLKPGEVMGIIADVADALAYAHDNEVVHRDIKPANIMRLDDGSVKVTDFGIARVVSNSQTQTGMVLGTPSYMSPEQVAAKKVDGRSDLFSLGSVCYELLCGEKAFVGDSIASLMYNISNVNYTPLREKRKGLPKCCYELVDGLLAKAVSKRPKKASAVVELARACQKKAV